MKKLPVIFAVTILSLVAPTGAVSVHAMKLADACRSHEVLCGKLVEADVEFSRVVNDVVDIRTFEMISTYKRTLSQISEKVNEVVVAVNLELGRDQSQAEELRAIRSYAREYLQAGNNRLNNYFNSIYAKRLEEKLSRDILFEDHKRCMRFRYRPVPPDRGRPSDPTPVSFEIKGEMCENQPSP